MKDMGFPPQQELAQGGPFTDPPDVGMEQNGQREDGRGGPPLSLPASRVESPRQPGSRGFGACVCHFVEIVTATVDVHLNA